MKGIKVISSINEITKAGVQYAHVSNPEKWIQIHQDSDGRFSVYGMVSGGLPAWVANGVIVRSWSNFNNTIRALKGFSRNGAWGMRHWDN